VVSRPFAKPSPNSLNDCRVASGLVPSLWPPFSVAENVSRTIMIASPSQLRMSPVAVIMSLTHSLSCNEREPDPPMIASPRADDCKPLQLGGHGLPCADPDCARDARGSSRRGVPRSGPVARGRFRGLVQNGLALSPRRARAKSVRFRPPRDGYPPRTTFRLTLAPRSGLRRCNAGHRRIVRDLRRPTPSLTKTAEQSCLPLSSDRPRLLR
jgi:hypothetical protein